MPEGDFPPKTLDNLTDISGHMPRYQLKSSESVSLSLGGKTDVVWKKVAPYYEK